MTDNDGEGIKIIKEMLLTMNIKFNNIDELDGVVIERDHILLENVY